MYVEDLVYGQDLKNLDGDGKDMEEGEDQEEINCHSVARTGTFKARSPAYIGLV